MKRSGKAIFWGVVVLVVIGLMAPQPPEEKEAKPKKMSRQEKKERAFIQRHVDKCGPSLDCLKFASAVWINYCMNEGARDTVNKEFGTEVCLYTLEDYCEEALQDKSSQEAVCDLPKKFRVLEKAVSY